MSIVEVLLTGVGLSMDAFAVGLTNGMVEPKMKFRKVLLIALFYGVFQFVMPVLGYFFSSIFANLVEKIAPWLSFVLLAFIGGKMIADGIKRDEATPTKPVGIGKLAVQALATSIDALAVGVSFLATETTVGLPFSIWWCSLCIGGITFTLSIIAVLLGKKVGNKLSDKAELLGGIILVGIGLKILIEHFVK